MNVTVPVNPSYPTMILLCASLSHPRYVPRLQKTCLYKSATSTAFRRPPPMVVVARWSSSSIAGDEADAPGLPSAFPWRGAPKTRVRGLLKGVGYAFQQRNHRKMMHLSEEAILVRARQLLEHSYTSVVAVVLSIELLHSSRSPTPYHRF